MNNYFIYIQEVELDEPAYLQALPCKDKSLSFNWSKKRPRVNKEGNELEVENVKQCHCKDYFSCEVLKDKQPLFSVYHCLKIAGVLSTFICVSLCGWWCVHMHAGGCAHVPVFACVCECGCWCVCVILFSNADDSSTTNSDTAFLDEVREATKSIRADWYNLAIELDINYATRRVSVSNLTDPCI